MTSLILTLAMLMGGVTSALGCPRSEGHQQAGCQCKQTESAADPDFRDDQLEASCCCVNVRGTPAWSSQTVVASTSRETDFGLHVFVMAALSPAPRCLQLRPHRIEHHTTVPPPTLVRLHALLLC